MNFFAWQRAVIASRDLDPKVQLTALRIALDSNSATGREIGLNAAQVATDRGVSERTVWRHLEQLVDAGWLIQTAKPTYSGRDTGGRRAQYALQIPGDQQRVVCQNPATDDTRPADSSDNTPPDLTHDTPHSSDTSPRNLSDDLPESSDTSTLKSSAKPTLDVARFSTTTRTTAAAAAGNRPTKPTRRRLLPPSVEILRGKLEASLLVVRWDALTDEHLDQIEALVDLHGDAPLIKAAMNAWRPDSPLQFAQGWIGAWTALPAPGARGLALVQKLCDTHGTKLSPSGVCNNCAADAKAGGR